VAEVVKTNQVVIVQEVLAEEVLEVIDLVLANLAQQIKEVVLEVLVLLTLELQVVRELL
tara:strand:+ start:322 stop:498 length:177 start_codon:yes stop_codon:yes gene_type:complete